MNYIFNKTNLNLDKLTLELVPITNKVVGLNLSTILEVSTSSELTPEELSLITAIISNHNPFDASAQIRLVVESAIEFGSELIKTFATENILMGITQAGKTKIVSDYLADVTRYAQTGSLYEVINEIDRLILLGIPQELSPFITELRLQQFKQKIITYLQG